MAEALYRKYRPQVFGDVIGQDHVEQTLKNAIEQDKVSHAYLFCGPRGTGKTTMARLLAKALLCKDAPTSHPDGTCEDCRLIAAGTHPDVYELDAASRTGVENVREEIIGRVQFAPTRGARKIYIIDEVHMLSTAAFNALLKTLEEPPDHVIFILATTDPQKVPETIHSRCQRFDFRRISPESLVSRMGAICVAEGVEFEGDALDLIAHRAEGGARNALTALEQLIAFSGGKVTLAAAEEMLGGMATSDMAEIVAAIGRRDAAACFAWVANYVETGADLAVFTRDLAEHIRNLYVLSLGGVGVPLEVSEAVRRQMVNELAYFGPDRLARMLCVLGDLSAELKTSTNARLSFEIAMTRLVRPMSDLTLEALAERLEALESASCGAVASGPGPQVPEFKPAAQPEAVQPVKPEKPEVISQAEPEAAQPVETAKVQVASEQKAAAEPVQVVETAKVAVQAADHVPSPEPKVASRPGWGKQDKGAARKSARKANLANPAALQRSWQQILSALKRVNPSHNVMFIGTKVSYDPNTDGFAVKFPHTYEYMFQSAQKPEVRQSLLQAVVQVMEEEVPIMLVRLSAEGKAQEVIPAFGDGTVMVRPQASAAAEQPAKQARAAQAVREERKPQAKQPEQPAEQQPKQEPKRERPQAEPQVKQVQEPAPKAERTQAAVIVPEPEVVDDDQVPLDIYESFGMPEQEPEPEHDDAWRSSLFDVFGDGVRVTED